MCASDGTSGQGAGRPVRRPVSPRPTHRHEDHVDDDPLVNRWQDGPWIGQYPLSVQPGEDDELGHRPARAFGRGARSPRRA